jgi:peptidoglycan/xylan/chitin deacetylase (PgdA/CDA1 family)
MDFKLMYPGFKSKALTFSYDDGVIQDEVLAEKMRKYGFIGTFNLNSGQSGQEKIRKDTFGNDVDCSHLNLQDSMNIYAGMEIATHTFSHPFMETLSYDQQSEEIRKDKDNLESLFSCRVIGAAYPYGTYNQDTLQALKENNISYARTVRSTYAFYRPYNFLLWHPTIHHNDPRLMEIVDKFLASEEELALCYIWGHAYEFALQHNFDVFDQIGEKLSGKDDIYYASNGEICFYIQNAELVYYKKREEGFFVNPSSIDVYLVTSKGERIVLHPYERRKYE